MRILVDIPNPDLTLLDEITLREAISRAEFIRRAIRRSLTPYRPQMDHSTFGAWSGTVEDGLTLQTRLRDEW